MSQSEPRIDGFAVGDLVMLKVDRPGEQPWRITEIRTDDPGHDGPYAILHDLTGRRSWSALRILRHAGPWAVVLTDELGYAYAGPNDILAENGPEGSVEVSIRRGAALPVQRTDGEERWRLRVSSPANDVAFRTEMDLVDEDGETTAVEAKLAQARAMCAGLNAAAANPGDPNRRTELAASLHDLADKLAAFEGEIPDYISLGFVFTTYDGRHVGAVDALAAALIGQAGAPKRGGGGGWQHRAETPLPGNLKTYVYTSIPAPAEEDPATLRARIAELQLENEQLRGEA